MQAARQALRTASHVTKSSVDAIHAPNCYLPASEAPSPLPYIVGGVVTGTAFLLTYKMYYWNWEKRVKQFYYEYNKTMAELADNRAQGLETADETTKETA